MRRRQLPTVTPKPRSNGSAVNLPYVSVRVLRSLPTRLGSSRPRHRIRMTVRPPKEEENTEARRQQPEEILLFRLLSPGFCLRMLTRAHLDDELLADLRDARI